MNLKAARLKSFTTVAPSSQVRFCICFEDNIGDQAKFFTFLLCYDLKMVCQLGYGKQPDSNLSNEPPTTGTEIRIFGVCCKYGTYPDLYYYCI